MDYVPAHGNTNMLDDREDTSGARVFDGEDQGKYRVDLDYWSSQEQWCPYESDYTVLLYTFRRSSSQVILTLALFSLGAGNRYRMQQLQQKDWIE